MTVQSRMNRESTGPRLIPVVGPLEVCFVIQLLLLRPFLFRLRLKNFRSVFNVFVIVVPVFLVCFTFRFLF